jgi:NADPH:quinone reductase-like Zn-dependent oxidoreductase
VGAGVNAVLELVGGSYLADSLRSLSPKGRLLLVGTVAGGKAELDLGLVLTRRLRISGTVLRTRPIEEKIALAREFSDRVLPLFDAGRLRPVIDRVFPFAQIREAHTMMEGNESFGKIVLSW